MLGTSDVPSALPASAAAHGEGLFAKKNLGHFVAS